MFFFNMYSDNACISIKKLKLYTPLCVRKIIYIIVCLSIGLNLGETKLDFALTVPTERWRSPVYQRVKLKENLLATKCVFQ